MTPLTALALAVIATPILFVVGVMVWRGCRWFMETLPEDQEIRPMGNKLMRVVQTMPGDSLSDGIRRAFVLSLEHGPVVLVHQSIPIVVSEHSTPYEAEQRWIATGKLYLRREVCNGK